MGVRRVVGRVVVATVLVWGTAGCGGGGDEREGGWQLTVYYTPVERYHEGPPRPVTGCLRALDCQRGDDDLGRYPGDFVDAVELEGNGRVTAGTHAGRVLNWSAEQGFWLDTVPRDAGGGVLRPFVSAWSDPGELAGGTRFRVEACGRTAEGTDVADEVCRRLRGADWQVGDPFAASPGGARHVHVYVGEESSAEFTESGWYTTLVDVELALRRP